MLHGLPAGAALELRAGVRVAPRTEGAADMRLLGPWIGFQTGPKLSAQEEADMNTDPFGVPRAGCKGSLCRSYVSDPEVWELHS